jgi:histidinol-phosphate aminotransferase
MGASSYFIYSVFITMKLQQQRIHGGPDAFGAVQFDFSTNSNACGPCPAALAAIQQADATRYPDASYAALRGQLAAFHGVDVQRVVLAASASEFIFRVTAMVAGRGGRTVGLPPFSYGDYAHAAAAHGLNVVDAYDAHLCWACEPCSPLGSAHEDWRIASDAVRVLDRAYEPLRLGGYFAHSDDLDQFWQLYSPNKALGLTGVRAAYAIAPVDAHESIESLNQLCPSWPIGAHGVAMLEAWTRPESQAWLAGSLCTLRLWKKSQVELCESFGWTVLPSLANFFVCHTGLDPVSISSFGDGFRIDSAMTKLRQQGIKLRDCTSFGLPGHVRISVQPPAAQDALHNAWLQIKGMT